MITVLRGGNIGDEKYYFKPDDVTISSEFVKKELFLKKGYMITPAVSSIDHIGKIALIDKDYSNVVVGGFVLMLQPFFNDEVISKYFLYAFAAKHHRENCRNITHKSGQAFYNLSREKLLNLPIPVPPLMEMKRIVDKIEELLPYINEYEIINSAIVDLKEKFPEQLKKSILQDAVQGKLVPQDPSDEPASILLERIREEKTRLIKEGKIKKDKNESVIFRRDNSYYEKSNGVERCIDEELPFEIPDSWCWARLKQLGITQTGNTPSKNHKEYFGDYIPFIGPGNISEHGIISSDKGLTRQGLEFGRLVKAGSILQVCIGGSIGKAAINQVDVTFNQQINSITPIACCKEYLFYVMTAPYFIKIIKERAGGTATPIINRGEWDNILIPLAPLKEQNKIVVTVKSAINFLRF